MTKPLQATERGLEPHWKIRVVLPGAILHLASRHEPDLDGRELITDLIEAHEYGDTVGYIDWDHVIAITWRYAP